jgi:prepilin-type processing-associated H-X9-DG protein
MNPAQSLRACLSKSHRCGGVTLLEVLVTIAVIIILAAILVPALARSRDAARLAQCVDNLRQLGLATQLYWDDNEDRAFPYLLGSVNGGKRYWFGWLKPGAEGERDFDPRLGLLYPYLQGEGVEICPSLDYRSTLYKLKARGAAFGYGYNLHLAEAPVHMASVLCPTEAVLMADAAQVNDFQAPASPERPMLEEFYYVNADDGTGYPNAHFRHHQLANVLFCDGHVDREKPVPGSLDLRLPDQYVGRLRAEILRVP